VITKPRPSQFTLPAAHVAWIDYSGMLHIGDVATGAQHVVATLPSAAGCWFVVAAGHIYWLDFNKNAGPIRGYDLATHKIQRLGRGEWVFAAPGGRHVYLERSATRLAEMPAGHQAGRTFRVPAGWHLACCQWDGAVAGGVIVYSAGGQGSVPVRSPLHHGFTEGDGTFSPDGRQLAVFVRRASINSSWPNHSELALINTRTGTLRVVRAAKLLTQEDAGWVLWLPGGRRLLAGALLYSYAVDTRTLAVRPFFFFFFFFFPGSDHDIMDSPDINFSTVLVPARQARQARRPQRAQQASR
jgi:hypothetical protein